MVDPAADSVAPIRYPWWPALWRRRPPTQGFTVRMDWSDGTHEFWGYATSERRAQVLRRQYVLSFGPVVSDPAVWQGLFYMAAAEVLPIAYADWKLHRFITAKCRASTCPSAAHPHVRIR